MTQDQSPTIATIIELFGGKFVFEDQSNLDRPDDLVSTNERLHAVIQQYRYPGEEDFRIGELAALLDAGANINARNEQGETLLLYAIENDWHFTPFEPHDYYRVTFEDTGPDHDIVRFLLRRGANVNLSDRIGRTPLHIAASKGYPKQISALLDKGADINARDCLDRTPLFYVEWNDKLTTTKLLADRGADCQARDKYGTSLLHLAAGYHDIEGMTYFLGRGIHLETPDDHGNTPLFHAIQHDGPFSEPYRKREAIRFLLESGADLHARNHVGDTPFAIAARSREKEVLEILHEYGDACR